jgi:histidyl-tRNA synthetase
MTTLEELRPLATTPEAAAALKHLEAALAAFAALGGDPERIRIDPTIARGLDYYTGLVFELDAPELGAEKQLLGGGAYDLSGVFQEPPIPSMGFALGFDRTLVALEKGKVTAAAPPPVDVILGALVPEAWNAAAQAAQALRAAGKSVELESQAISIKKLLSRASQIKAKRAAFIGAKELQTGVAAVKNLADGTQSEVPLGRLATAV